MFRTKIILISAWLLLIFTTISWLFWKNEVKFLQATPVPAQYKKVTTGDVVEDYRLTALNKKDAVFLHFFNPECPCSKFNLPHVRSLIHKYDDKLKFAVVVLDAEKEYTEKEIQDKLGAKVPVLFEKRIADKCGVYSTPQAVILDAGGKLYYRGNYNKSRYCTNKSSNYAEMAIDSFLLQITKPEFDQFALKAYGCELPKCEK
jgi:thioredoxin-related protein